MRLHGRSVWINGGSPYPFILHNFPWFNAPLIELCHQVAASLEKPISIVDVGASVGDSVLLLKERCSSLISQVVCLEGDPEAFDLLRHNVSAYPEVTCVQALLARDSSLTRSLVRHHPGTAAGFGDDQVPARALDSIPSTQGVPVHLLKIDVDGSDGEVLWGARQLLRKMQPAVIFEWHPRLIQRAGNPLDTAFSALSTCGYNRYVWFHNTGKFSHVSSTPDATALTAAMDQLAKAPPSADAHFDIVALPDSSPLREMDLAGLTHANPFRS